MRVKYESESGGIELYEIFDDRIILKFKGDGSYLYDYDKPGKLHVEEMKKLAVIGTGLTGYVSRYVRDNYSRKVKDF